MKAAVTKATLLALLLAATAACATASPAATAAAAASPTGWHTERSGTTSTLSGVACLTASHCFAVGAAGSLLATEHVLGPVRPFSTERGRRPHHLRTVRGRDR